MSNLEELLVPQTSLWRDNAHCQKSDPEIFFPTKKSDPDQSQQAKQVCAPCPVRLECLQDALLRRESHGVWGGKDAQERRAMIHRLENKKR